MLLLFLIYCGTSLHGGIFLERQRHTKGILFPNFFLTYLLATKVESKKTYTINVVGDSSILERRKSIIETIMEKEAAETD